MKTQDGVQRVVRLSVNLSPTVLDELKGYADKNGITVTEAVRHAISVLKFVDQAQADRTPLYIEEHGKLRKVQFMFVM